MGAPSGGPSCISFEPTNTGCANPNLESALSAAALKDLLCLVVLCLPDPCDVASYRTITRTARFLTIDPKVGVVGQKVELVAESLNDCAGEILRPWESKIVERFVHVCKGTILARERRKVNRSRFFPTRECRVDTNDGVPRRQFLV